MDLKAFDESIRSNNFYCDFRSFTIENFPIIFNNRIYVSIKSNRSISFNFSIILIFLKRLLINRKYNLIILEEFFFFLSLVSTVSKISYLFFSLGWKESTFRLSLPCRPRWCNGSAFALDHFSFFFFPFLPPPPPPLPIWSPGYTTHFLAPLSLSSTYFLRYRLFSLFFTPRSQITLLYRPFERSWFGGGRNYLASLRGTGQPFGSKGIGKGRGEEFYPPSFFFS